jgi:hypothetical protein
MSKCGHIIPPNLHPKTHVLKKKLILQPRNNQVQHIVVKVMGERGKVTFFPECAQWHIKCDRSYSCRIVSPCTAALARLRSHGEIAIDRHLYSDCLLPQKV